MFQIKVCGITSVRDAVNAVEAGVDAIGLNFYPPSPRSVSVETAKQIVAAVPQDVVTVGIFVNEQPARIREIVAEVGLDAVQLHGDETPETISLLPRVPYIKAFRVDGRGLLPIEEQLAKLHEQARRPEMVLFDARTPKNYGGTGQTFDWRIAVEFTKLPAMPPLILAGGLSPDNVASAIRLVHPKAVDVASGVEDSPGRKSREKLFRFVENARSAWMEP
ncbi:MAG: phosphoribosylanthranilate isomerase [Planctomycetota bacterium]|nr:MAG: phosphoribosylanthranilate isomerase [Planctomycetota bacterium]